VVTTKKISIEYIQKEMRMEPNILLEKKKQRKKKQKQKNDQTQTEAVMSDEGQKRI
jgi:hypothetical protein